MHRFAFLVLACFLDHAYSKSIDQNANHQQGAYQKAHPVYQAKSQYFTDLRDFAQLTGDPLNAQLSNSYQTQPQPQEATLTIQSSRPNLIEPQPSWQYLDKPQTVQSQPALKNQNQPVRTKCSLVRKKSN